jgi:hypothetical protein
LKSLILFSSPLSVDPFAQSRKRQGGTPWNHLSNWMLLSNPVR